MTDPNPLSLIASDAWMPIDLMAAARMLGGHYNRASVRLREVLGLPGPKLGAATTRLGTTFVDTLPSGERVARCVTPFGRERKIRYLWRRFPAGTEDAEILASAREGAHYSAEIFDADRVTPAPRRQRRAASEQISNTLTSLSDADLLDLIEQTEANLNAAHAERIARTLLARRTLATLTRAAKETTP